MARINGILAMGNHWKPVILGVTLAITITTVMDANGYSMFSALPLMPLFGLLWWWQKFSKAEIRFKWGKGSHYAYAVAYPLVVMMVLAATAALAGALRVQNTVTGGT